MKQVWQAEDGTTFDSEEECIIYEQSLTTEDDSSQNFRWLLGRKCFSKEDEKAIFIEYERLRKKWIEQNDINYLFEGYTENLDANYNSLEPFNDWSNCNDPCSMREIFRSVDNQYFRTNEECKMHEEKIKDKDLTQIIDKDRVWRSKWCNCPIYFETQEECLLHEETIKKEMEEEARGFLAGEAWIAEYEAKKLKNERKTWGVNWGEEPEIH